MHSQLLVCCNESSRNQIQENEMLPTFFAIETYFLLRPRWCLVGNDMKKKGEKYADAPSIHQPSP